MYFCKMNVMICAMYHSSLSPALPLPIHQTSINILCLVAVAKRTLGGVHNIADLDVLGKTKHGENIIKLDVDAVPLRVKHTLTIVLGEAASVLLLPLPPNTVDLSVVHEEERLVGRSSRVHFSAERGVDATVRTTFGSSVEVGPVAGLLELVDALEGDGGNHRLVSRGFSDLRHVAEQAVAAAGENLGLVLKVLGSELGESTISDTLETAAGCPFPVLLISVTTKSGLGHEGRAQKTLLSILGPVPVGSGALVAAVAESLLVDDSEVSVPRKERSATVDCDCMLVKNIIDILVGKLTPVVELKVDVGKVVVER